MTVVVEENEEGVKVSEDERDRGRKGKGWDAIDDGVSAADGFDKNDEDDNDEEEEDDENEEDCDDEGRVYCDCGDVNGVTEGEPAVVVVVATAAGDGAADDVVSDASEFRALGEDEDEEGTREEDDDDDNDVNSTLVGERLDLNESLLEVNDCDIRTELPLFKLLPEYDETERKSLILPFPMLLTCVGDD